VAIVAGSELLVRGGDRIIPLAFITVLVVSGFMLTKEVPRWSGAVLILLYVVFAVGGFLL
jgi:cation:H+ antiporter